MARRIRKPKQHAKRVNYQLIPKDTVAGRPLYRMLNELIEKHHEHLTNARILLAWNLAWKPDADGRTTLGKCKKASDLDRELAPFDFVILLRKEFVESADVTDEKRRAVIDHELCHAQVRVDKDGEPMRDERGRVVYRIRKHDIEEFSDIIFRHGTYMRDLELFFSAARRSKQGNLLEEPAPKKPSAPLPAPPTPITPKGARGNA